MKKIKDFLYIFDKYKSYIYIPLQEISKEQKEQIEKEKIELEEINSKLRNKDNKENSSCRLHHRFYNPRQRRRSLRKPHQAP